ncbi:uncharacterized protein LOC132624356 [Lycium barbarum]|uniref:uncharacterized protein LOC132624356 n=1 Tax=Lycium barbarum TaxID=112863 RepID=UPI00293EACE9|nr:uncharacterized protein LOC132624356 [Lycium barbarum]
MNFTKVLVTFFLIVTLLENVKVVGENGLSCRGKCVLACIFCEVPGCRDDCMKQCHIKTSPENLNCNLACSIEYCSKSKEDSKIMKSCLEECSTKLFVDSKIMKSCLEECSTKSCTKKDIFRPDLGLFNFLFISPLLFHSLLSPSPLSTIPPPDCPTPSLDGQRRSHRHFGPAKVATRRRRCFRPAIVATRRRQLRVEKVLEAVHIAANKNTVPGDVSSMVPGGIRMGTPALTSREFIEEDFVKVAEFFDAAVKIALKIKAETSGTKLKDFMTTLQSSASIQSKIAKLRHNVEEYAKQFPTIGFEKETMKYKN